MTIKKRLVVSNLLMLIVPAILVVLISVGVLAVFAQFYWESIKSAVHSQENIAIVKNMVDLYRHEHQTPRSKSSAKEWKELEKLLSEVGYRLHVIQDGKPVSSNLTPEDEKAMSGITDKLLEADGSAVFMTDTSALVRISFTQQGKTTVLTAVNTLSGEDSMDIGQKIEIFLRNYLWIILALTLLVIAMTNGVLSSRVAKSLLEPLALLGSGAREIGDGNLEFEIQYKGKDEFKPVCDDFDRMRLRLKESVQDQMKYEEARREFLAGISHDLRTPLTAIKGYVEGLRDGVANTPERQKKYLDTIYQKTCDMDVLVDRLFLLSKLDTGQFPFHFTKVELRKYLEWFCLGVKEEFLRKGLRIELDLRAQENVFVQLDGEHMRWVLLNLLENSAKYTTKQTATVKITSWTDKFGAAISLADDGPGVAQEAVDRLFDIFYRCDKSRTNPSSGSGLGLAIAKRIVQAHKGTICARSQAGLTILIWLPLEKEGDNETDSDYRG